VRVTSSETSATLVVEYSGPGVPDELLARLGERLLRLDPSRDRRTGGTGLGLSIVRSIAARHDATLTFDRGDLGGLRVMLVFARDAGHDVG
jgi:signal transduction histidine kinase